MKVMNRKVTKNPEIAPACGLMWRFWLAIDAYNSK